MGNLKNIFHTALNTMFILVIFQQMSSIPLIGFENFIVTVKI